MKLAILTFQFAHNYGALLQAYALKEFICSQGHNVDIVNYYPDTFKATYNASPFAKGVPLRGRVKLALRYSARAPQVRVFEAFKQDCLQLADEYSDQHSVCKKLNEYDAVIFGSDQIWNTGLTRNDAVYWGNEINTRKLAYAVSLGTSSLTLEQKELCSRLLPAFEKIALRETGLEHEVGELTHKKIEVVMDPVFLLARCSWEKFSVAPKEESRYMLFYYLKEDSELHRLGLKYAEKQGLQALEIHPTLAARHKGCRMISPVGPKEFLGLVNHAACICTNSFHAMAFSTIFAKDVIHLPNRNSPGRTVTLLQRAGMPLCSEGSFPLYSMEKAVGPMLEEQITRSKKYLTDALAY